MVWRRGTPSQFGRKRQWKADFVCNRCLCHSTPLYRLYGYLFVFECMKYQKRYQTFLSIAWKPTKKLFSISKRNITKMENKILSLLRKTFKLFHTFNTFLCFGSIEKIRFYQYLNFYIQFLNGSIFNALVLKDESLACIKMS